MFFEGVKRYLWRLRGCGGGGCGEWSRCLSGSARRSFRGRGASFWRPSDFGSRVRSSVRASKGWKRQMDTKRAARTERGSSHSSPLVALADLFVESSTTQPDVGWSSTNRSGEPNLFGERSHLRRHSYFGAGTVPANRVKRERTEPRRKRLLAVELAERAAQDIGDLAYGARCSGTVDDRCG